MARFLLRRPAWLLLVASGLLLNFMASNNKAEVPTSLPNLNRELKSDESQAEAHALTQTTELASSVRRFPPPRLLAQLPRIRSSSSHTEVQCNGHGVMNARTCRFTNVCYNTSGPKQDGRGKKMQLYTGQHQPQHPLKRNELERRPCISLNDGFKNDGMLSSWVCHDDNIEQQQNAIVFTNPVMDSNSYWRPMIFNGDVPMDRVARWVEEPTLLWSRHYPRNWAHAIADDVFGIWSSLSDFEGWSGDAVGPDSKRVAVFLDDWTGRNLEWPATTMMELTFHDRLSLLYRAEVDGWTQPAAGKELVCFRSMVAGSPGRSLHRSGAYAYHPARDLTIADKRVGAAFFDPAHYIAQHAAFAEWLGGRWGLPSKAQAQATLTERSGGKGDVLLVVRRGKREIRNEAELIEGLREVAGGRRVVAAMLERNTTAEQMLAFQQADVVIAVAGAAVINVLFMRPGTAWVELMPPKSAQYVATGLAIAQRLGVTWYSVPTVVDCTPLKPGDDTDPHNVPFVNVDTKMTKGVVALALGTEP